MKVNFSNSVTNVKDRISRGFQNHIKPKLNDGLKYTKDLKDDVVDFVKKNPKKTGTIAAASLLGISAIALGVKAVKDFVETKKQNKILKHWVANQAESINDYRKMVKMNTQIIGAQNDVIDAMKSKHTEA